jgi:bud site selection protein 31
MFTKYKKISKEVYEYCIRNKLVDGPLIAKWKKPGYERLCSTYVINTKNYKFGTTSICRVPKQSLSEGTVVEDPFTGCNGCATGPGGQRNIFGNKYGQYLAAIQVAREEEQARREALKKRKEAEASADEEATEGKKRKAEDADTDEDSDKGDSDGEGPSPARGGAGAGAANDDGAAPDSIWAVNEKERNLETADMAESEPSGGKRSKY